MTSKEKFKRVCDFKGTDDIPIDYQAHKDTDKRLREHLGCQTEQELLDRLGSDFFYLPCRDISQKEGFLK